MTGRSTLTRAQVLDAALELIDEEGLDALTMRRLGKRLDRTPMVLYRYAASRAELLDAVVESVHEKLLIPDDGTSWQDRLRVVAHRYRAIALDHPNVVPLLATRPLATPLGMRPLGTLHPLERMLDLLIDAGFAPADALHVHRSWSALVLGHVLNELQEVVTSPDETDPLLRLGLHRLPPQEFPRLRSLAGDLAVHDGEAELDRSITILLTGLGAQLIGTAVG